MIEVSEVVELVLGRDVEERRRAAALLLVRYAGFHGDRRFSPWFPREQRVLGDVAQVARQVFAGHAPDARVADLKDVVQAGLEDSDPDGPPFAAEVFDHLVFADEVLAFLSCPENGEALARAYERAEELAEAHEEMGREGYEGEDGWKPAALGELEWAARTRDAQDALDNVALDRSAAFASLYADVIARCYTDEDAGGGLDS
ncbi:hypothetical protein SAMN05216267_1001328 [Actinacidiphila rubida]|uniref:Uncharacterized protein n=1 Tax=Actinacidiphila rubida TaxID=310780 RepID=A0A1H8DVS9_9ACTN|nr:hypothetical protein SAMN05216267_1001328 [Actinacidiphila rubida]